MSDNIIIDKIISFLETLRTQEPKEIHLTAIDRWNSQTNFKVEELVPKDIYNLRGQKAIELISSEAINTLLDLRQLFDTSITINNWLYGGRFEYRGLRPPIYYDNKLSFSQHIFGRAFDFDVRGHTADQSRQKIIGWKKEGKLPYLTGLELGVSWEHIDTRLCDRLEPEDGLFKFGAN